MMFQEEDAHHRAGKDEEEGGMNIGRRTQGEIGEPPVGDVPPAAVVTTLSEYLPHSKDQTPKKRGRPKKILLLKEVNQRAKDVSERGVLLAESGTFKAPCQQPSTNLDTAFENGPKGSSNQEQGIALSTKKCSNMLMNTLAGEQQVTPTSSGPVPTVQDDFPPFSVRRHSMTKSNTETRSKQDATERMCRKPDRYPGGGEGRNVVAHTPWISNLSEKDKVKGESDARLHASARLLQNSWGGKCQGQGRERGIAVEQQEKIITAESVMLTETPTWTCEETDKFRDCHSSSVMPNVSQSDTLQCAEEAVKGLVDAVVPHEPMVKHGPKGGPPKRSMLSKMQVRQAVGGPKDHGNYLEENSTCEKRNSSFYQRKGKLGEWKMKESDKSFESIQMGTAVNKDSSKTDVRLVDTNVCQVPSVSFSRTGSDPVTCPLVNPKKKVGRPQKKHENIETEGTIGILGTDCNVSVKESVKTSLKDLSDKKALEKTDCVQKTKRGRGRYARKPVCIIPRQEQVVGMVIESTAETRTPPRKRDQEVIGGKRVTGTECKGSTLLELKATAVPTPVRPLPHVQRKRGRRKKIICLNEKTPNSFEPQNCSVSQQVILPPSKTKSQNKGMAEMSATFDSVKATGKEKSAVVRQRGNGGSIAVSCRNREAEVKFKRKIGRPFKRKTLIKMAKQLELPQLRTAKATDMYEENHPENIPYQTHKYRLKRERKTVELYSQVSQLRRYSRACKLNANYSAEKQEHHPASSRKRLLSSVSKIPVPNLDSEKMVSPSSAVLSVSKKGSVTTKSEGRDCLKVSWKKGKHLKNKMKRKVNIKVEEIQQPVLTALSKIKNPSAFQEILPMLSKETTAVSGSARSTEKKPLTNCKMRSKAKQINQLQFSGESGQSLRAQSLCKIHNDTAAAKVALPVLIHKAEFEETEVMSHKGTHNVTVKKIQGKGRMSQKKVTVKCEPRLDAAVINDSESHSPFLPSQRFIESTKSGDKGPQIHGRQCKNEALVPTVKFREEVKKDVAYESLTDQSYHPSQECPLPSGKVMSCLKISANSEMKRPRKVDRRRKWFRHQKAQELKALSEVKPTEPVGQFTSQIDSREEVLSVTQKHLSKRKLETGDQLFNDSDPFTKRPRKAFGSRKRRRRKRSWWDDRGKGKGEIPDAMLKPSLPSVEGKAEVEVVVKSDFDVKITANQESNTSYQHKMQNSNELPSHTQVVPQRSGTDRISEVVYFSDQINLSTSHNTEKSQKNIFADETEKKPFHDNSISENQRLASDPENQDDQTLPIKNLGPLPEPCKITVDMASDELQEKERRNKTNTSTSPALNDEVNTLETDSLEPDPLVKAEITRQKSRRSGNEDDRQTQIVTTEENALRDHSVLLNPKEVDQVETKVEMFVSSESKTLNPANLRSSKTLSEEDGLCDVFLNTPDVEKKQTMSLQQNVLIQDLPQDKKGWDNYKDGVDQSDQEVEEGYVEEDPVESMEEEELPVTSHSKARRPGRPAKDKGKKPIECQFCGRPFHHISAYVIHRRVHTGERPYSCQECGKTFAQLSNLNTHRKTHKVSGDLHGLLSEQEELLDHCQKHAPGPEKRDHLTRQAGNEEGGDKKQYRSFPYSKDGKPHICSVCGKGFRYTSMLKIHMRVHSGEKPYSCKVCGKSFSQACSVSVHEKIHWSIKPYVCNFCGKGFSQLGTLRTHFYSHVGVYKDGGKQVSNKVTFQCRACNKSFSIWHQYNFHLKSHLDVQFFSCDICGRQYRQMCDLSFHRQSCGKQIIEETVRHTLESDTLQESRKLKGQPFQPHVLQYSQLQSNYQHQRQGKQAFSPSDLTSQRPLYQLPEHKTFPELMNPQPQRDASQQRNHSSRSKCWQMPNPAYSQMIIKSPRKRHPSRHPLSTSVHLDRKFDPRKYLCPRCGRLFRHLGRLRAHMLTHIRGHSYTCGRCGKTLENWNKFWLHQRVHRQKQGRFFCPKCGQGFRFAGMYKKHLQEHKELTVFACSSCPQTFSHQEALKAHRRDQHKPHKCNVCGKRFHLQGNLQRHNLVHRHTHPECCPHCSLLFASVTCLQDHMMTHKSPTGPLLDMSAQQNVLPYQCGECESSFKNLDLLFRHQLSHPPPRDRKPWRNGEIVGLQKKSPYVFAPLDDPSMYPSSSSSVAQVSAHYTNPSSHEGSVISHTYSHDHFQLASNKPSHPSKLPSLENNAHLPQTLSPSAAVPFSDAQPLPQYPQTSTSVQSPSHNQDQTSHKCEKPFPQKPLRTYEKSKRGVPSAPSSSVKPHNEENCRDSIACAECGAQFNVVPELYEHYLQHARGEL